MDAIDLKRKAFIAINEERQKVHNKMSTQDIRYIDDLLQNILMAAADVLLKEKERVEIIEESLAEALEIIDKYN